MAPLTCEGPPPGDERWPLEIIASLARARYPDTTDALDAQDVWQGREALIDAIDQAGAMNPDLGRWLSHLAIISVEIAA
jgi:hypothetical protein